MWYGASVVTAFPLALLVGFLIGLALERAIARPLRGRPPVALMAATLGAYYLIRGTTMISSRGFETGSYGLPEHVYRLGSLAISTSDIIALAIAGGSVAGIVAMHRLTSLGVAMRAVAEDAFGAAAYGISVKTMTALSWGFAGVTAAAAALALATKAQVAPTLDFYALKALAVSLLAGLDSVAGVTLAGIVLGLGEQYASLFLDPYVPGLGDRLAFVLMLVVLLVKPYGLFGTERIERV
jgi:branched-chain amino acid transport system permease protein